MELFNIAGKKAIVTGGTRGLGYGMAEGLMEAGCEVVIVGTSDKVYDVAKGFCDRGFKCHGVKADFSKREQVYQGFNDCVAALGGDLDIIVNAHGIQRRHSAEVFPIEEWDEVLNVNLNSVFILCQEAAKIMLKKGYGKSIIPEYKRVIYYICNYKNNIKCRKKLLNKHYINFCNKGLNLTYFIKIMLNKL